MEIRKRTTVSLLIGFLLVTGFCINSTSDAAEYAKTIVIGRNEDSRNLDPVTQDGNVNIWVFNLVLEGLVKTNDDGTKIEPALAKSWDVSEDGLTYTFHVRERA